MTDNSDELALDDPTHAAFKRDVLHGLSMPQKAIPARYFYDHRGSELFEQITGADDYYPTRTEAGLLEQYCPQVADIVGEGVAVVEFGAGSGIKTELLLDAVKPAVYVPNDISGEFLEESAARIGEKFPDIEIVPLVADFSQPLAMPEAISGLPRLGFFPGSTIGNMVPSEAVDLLRRMHDNLGIGASLLIGMDRIKDIDVLKAAYDDSEGITAEFNLNLIRRIARELGADISPEQFDHEARWNEEMSRIEMHLKAREPLTFSIDGQHFGMAEGETIHTENSHKYDENSGRAMLRAAGWRPTHYWTDEQDYFALILAEAMDDHIAP